MGLMKINNTLTMSSVEITLLLESRHDTVKLSMDRLVTKGLITITSTEEPTKGGGKPTVIYHVSKRDSYVVVAQLSPEFTARLVDRWQELENANKRKPMTLLESAKELVASLERMNLNNGYLLNE